MELFTATEQTDCAQSAARAIINQAVACKQAADHVGDLIDYIQTVFDNWQRNPAPIARFPDVVNRVACELYHVGFQVAY